MPKITVQGSEITIISKTNEDFISLTDMAKKFGNDQIIQNWLRNKDTIEFLGIWEHINNPHFKPLEFDRFKTEAGFNRFFMSPKKWISSTNAIGLISKSGRYSGGTFAHKDIAFEFGSWLSPEFKLYLIKEFQRLKIAENKTQSLNWSLTRTLAKINYKIHTDAIKEKLIPKKLTQVQESRIYASEAEILNISLFGTTAKGKNLRDKATIEQLIVLSNLESINSTLIRSGIAQSERIIKLNETAIDQMKSLLQLSSIKELKKLPSNFSSQDTHSQPQPNLDHNYLSNIIN